MLEGLPSIFEYLIRVVTGQRQQYSLAVVIYYLLGDLVNAAEHALTHYLPLTLTESFLQNSSIGTPYQKWARFTNEDFQKVDLCLQRLIPACWQWYEQNIDRSSGADFVPTDQSSFGKLASIKDAWHWFHAVNTQYACCVVSPDRPALTLSAINIRGWVDPVEGRFLDVLSRFTRNWAQQPPPIVTKSVREIADRSVITELQGIGLARLKELRQTNGQLAGWLRANYTMEEVTAPHQGTLSDCWLG